MMLEYGKLEFSDDVFFKKKGKKNKVTSDTIYTFDIEVSSLFKLDGVWQSFDYSRDQKEYSGVEKAGVPYIWMFGVEDKVYYGRDFRDFKKVLLKISNPILHKIIWVHNLSYEFQFLLDLISDYKIENMVCRDALKPISFNIKELNIEFRCSYMLTNMSLDNASKEYGTEYKRTGTYDYNKARGKDTPLSKTEMLYCEYDIRSLHSVIKYYRKKYIHLANCPLTSTGEVRKNMRDHLDFWYFYNKTWKQVPDRLMYLRLKATFAGGYTHANMIHANRVQYGVTSKDIASSYPAVLVTEKYPCRPFKEYSEERYKQLSVYDSHCWVFMVEIRNLKSKYYNHYISYSKVVDYDIPSMVTDNGRVVECDHFTLWITEVDLELIKENYNCDIKFLQIFGAVKDYLDLRIIKFVLDQYKGKTELKGVEGMEDLYRVKKANNNCVYGVSCTDKIKGSANYGPHIDRNTKEKVTGWYKLDYRDGEKFDKFVDKTLNELKTSYSNLLSFSTGLYCTCYARRNLYSVLLQIDSDQCYADTDSLKYLNNHDDIFEKYNNNMIEKYKAVIKHYPSLTLDDFMPKDINGNKRPIGFYEDDGYYEEFKTLGAKKYAYRDKKGLHITVSGVSKSGVTALNDDINNFKKGFKWGYEESGKLTHVYNNTQIPFEFKDYKGKTQVSNQIHGVVLQPTTYTLGITSEYESLINEEYDRRFRDNV